MSAARGGQAGSHKRPNDSRSLREIILRAIIRSLYEGRYDLSQRLIEAELTAAHGVSRGPVREALNRLAAMGIVELKPPA
jgi:DNA-binding GntR family transcriptional regulator